MRDIFDAVIHFHEALIKVHDKQVASPICVLSFRISAIYFQDRVVEFAKMSQQELLEATEKAVSY